MNKLVAFRVVMIAMMAAGSGLIYLISGNTWAAIAWLWALGIGLMANSIELAVLKKSKIKIEE